MTSDSCELSWDEVDRLSRELAGGIVAAAGVDAFDRVIGIARGGWVPAVLVASHLRIGRTESVQVRFYEGDRRLDTPKLLGNLPAAAGPSGDPNRTLLLDEILDSGSTMRFLHDCLPDATLATLVARRDPEAAVARGGGLAAFDLAGEEEAPRVWTAHCMHTESWILFPWSPPEDHEAVQRAAETT